MALQMTGLGPDDYAEIVECLLLGAAACETRAPELCAYRRDLADRIGDALDTLPAPSPAPACVPADE